MDKGKEEELEVTLDTTSGKLRIKMGEDGISLGSCNAIETDPKRCETCKQKFKCWTERKTEGEKNSMLNLGGLPLIQIMKMFDDGETK